MTRIPLERPWDGITRSRTGELVNARRRFRTTLGVQIVTGPVFGGVVSVRVSVAFYRSLLGRFEFDESRVSGADATAAFSSVLLLANGAIWTL